MPYVNEDDYRKFSLNSGFFKLMYVLTKRNGPTKITFGNGETLEFSASEQTELEQYIIQLNGPLYRKYNKAIQAAMLKDDD